MRDQSFAAGIIGKRYDDAGMAAYLVLWDNDDESWEYTARLDQCTNLLEDYERRNVQNNALITDIQSESRTGTIDIEMEDFDPIQQQGLVPISGISMPNDSESIISESLGSSAEAEDIFSETYIPERRNDAIPTMKIRVKKAQARSKKPNTQIKRPPMHWKACQKCGGNSAVSRDHLSGDPGKLLTCCSCSSKIHFYCLTKQLQKTTKSDNYKCGSCLIDDPTCFYCKLKLGEIPKPINVLSARALAEAELFDKEVMFRCFRCNNVTHMTCLIHHYSLEFADLLVSSIKYPIGSVGYFARENVCLDCTRWNADVESILTWRENYHPINLETQATIEEKSLEAASDREYLVKFQGIVIINEGRSHLHNAWVSNYWLESVRKERTKLKNFLKRVEEEDAFALHRLSKKKAWPKAESEVVDSEWTRVEKILDIEYIDGAQAAIRKARSKKKGKQRIDDDSEEESLQLPPCDDLRAVQIKWAGLPYDVATWELYPSASHENVLTKTILTHDNHLCQEIDIAYKAYVKGMEISATFPSTTALKFEEIKSQPISLVGGTLKDYQLDGLNWLLFQWHKGSSSILADDMGLVSLISVLCLEQRKWPFLIIVPTTTIGNWIKEFETWSPQIIAVAIGGTKYAREIIRDKEVLGGSKGSGLKCHVVVASYEHTLLDGAFYKNHEWEIMICDEGHRLKNDDGKIFNAMNAIKAKHRILLSGTPLQNNLRELFNLMSFLVPEEFTDGDVWSEKYSQLSEEKVLELHKELRPYFLRRTRGQVLKDLPPKVERLIPIVLTTLQKKLYKAVYQRNSSILRAIGAQINSTTTNSTPLHNILMELRKLCGHPYLLNDVEPSDLSDEEVRKAYIEASGKLQLLSKMLPKLKERGHRVLIFSQFKMVLDILEDFLVMESYQYCRLDGDTPTLSRTKIIDNYNKPNSEKFIFLLTTRTGGVGINLVTADTVIMYDADWNPHQDLQAIARAHRIGQTKPVVVYKLFTRERIIEIGRQKLVLDHLIVESMDSSTLDKSELSSIIRFGAEEIFASDENDELNASAFKYDDETIEKLLDRSALLEEDKLADAIKVPIDCDGSDDQKKPNSFSFAKVWTLEKDVDTIKVDIPIKIGKAAVAIVPPGENIVDDEEFWSKLLKNSASDAKAETEIDQIVLGKRRKARVNYAESSKKAKIPRAVSVEGESEEDDEYEPPTREDTPDSIADIPSSPEIASLGPTPVSVNHHKKATSLFKFGSASTDPSDRRGPQNKPAKEWASKISTQKTFTQNSSQRIVEAALGYYGNSYVQDDFASNSHITHVEERSRNYTPGISNSCWICGSLYEYHEPIHCPAAHDTLYLRSLLQSLETETLYRSDPSRILTVRSLLKSCSERTFGHIPTNPYSDPGNLVYEYSPEFDDSPKQCCFCDAFPYHGLTQCGFVSSHSELVLSKIHQMEWQKTISAELAYNMRCYMRAAFEANEKFNVSKPIDPLLDDSGHPEKGKRAAFTSGPLGEAGKAVYVSIPAEGDARLSRANSSKPHVAVNVASYTSSPMDNGHQSII